MSIISRKWGTISSSLNFFFYFCLHRSFVFIINIDIEIKIRNKTKKVKEKQDSFEGVSRVVSEDPTKL